MSFEKVPPGPRGLSIAKLIGERKRDPLALYLRLVQEYGDVVYFKVGAIGYCLVNHPDHIRRVLQENYRNYPKGPGYERLRVLLGQGLLTNEGASWHRQRKLAQPAFHQARIVEFSKTVAKLARELADEWGDRIKCDPVIDVALEMNKIALHIVGETLLGADPSSRASQIRDSLLEVLRFSEKRGMNWLRIIDVLFSSKDRNIAFKLEKILPTPANIKFQVALKSLDQLVMEVIRNRREERKKVSAESSSRDLLSLFMEAQDEDDGTQMSDQQLRDEIMSILMAGHETTATALTWTWHLLSQYPEETRKMEQEIDRVLTNREIQFEDLAKLEYTHHVFSESIRYYPPFWRYTRQALKPDRLGEYEIPEGTVMIVSPYVTHRNPVYWKEPEKFSPARFMEPGSADRHRFAFIPFGAGPRVCIGANFAVMESMMVLATLARRFRLQTLPNFRFDFEANITLRPSPGLSMKVSERRSAP